MALGDGASSPLLGLGMVFPTSRFLLRWWMIPDGCGRHVWIAGGPRPHDDRGGGPFWLLVY